jgi:hypothetical protein
MSTNYGPSIATSNLVLYLDAGNPKSYSNNVHPYPLDIGTWAIPGGAYQATLSRDTTVTDSPVGGVPLKIATSAATPNSSYVGTYNNSNWNLAPAANGQTWTASFWVKGSSAFSASAMIFEANSSGNYTALGQGFYNVTTSWTRVSVTYTMTQATTAYVQMRFDNYNASTNMWVDGLQVEKNSSATTFNPRTNANGTNWYDLSGNNNHFKIYNGPTYDNSNFGSISFDGVNDYAASNNNINLTSYSSIVSEVWFMSNVTSPSSILIEHTADWNTNTGGWGLAINTNGTGNSSGTMHTNHNSEGARNYLFSIGSSWNCQVNIFSIVSDSTGRLTYCNGNLVSFNGANGYPTTTVTSAGGSFPNAILYLGSRGGTLSFLNGRISSVKIYGIKATSNQLLQNFNALRGRYSI